MELKPGDVVILKSGGHPVTVAEVNDRPRVPLDGREGDLFRETLPLPFSNPRGRRFAMTGMRHEEDEAEDDEEKTISRKELPKALTRPRQHRPSDTRRRRDTCFL